MLTSPLRTECGMFMMCCMQRCMSVSTGFVVGGCTVSRRYIKVCNRDVFSVVNMCLDHLMFCVLVVEGEVIVMLSLTNMMNPSPYLCDLSVRTGVNLCTFGVFALGVGLVS